jgi:stage V sporulation protein S
MTTVEDRDEDVVLRVSSSSSPQSVASAICKSILDSHKYPAVRAIGHGAIGQAAKAVAIARGYIAPKGIDLACIMGFDTVDGTAVDGTTKELSAVSFRTFPR